jgi:hypothetical protein
MTAPASAAVKAAEGADGCPGWCTSRHRPVYGGGIVHTRWFGRGHQSVALLQIADRPVQVTVYGDEDGCDVSGLTVKQAGGLGRLLDQLGADYMAGLLAEAVRSAADQTTPQATKTEDAA